MFKTGDIFIEKSGVKLEGGVSFTVFAIFEYREGADNGSGFRYNCSGSSYEYKWAYPKVENRVELPADVLFSFKHGSDYFHVEDSKITDDMMENLRRSGFIFVSEEKVSIAVKIDGIKTADEIKENWEFLKENGFNGRIVETVLSDIGINFGPAINGEIGIRQFQIYEYFCANFGGIERKFLEEK